MPRVHELKEDPAPFEAVWRRRKRHEVRANDRGYQVGDVVLLREHGPRDGWTGVYSGRWVEVEITDVTPGGSYGLPDEVCCWSFLELNRGAGTP